MKEYRLSLINRFVDWLFSLFEAFEADGGRKMRFLVAAVGIAVTVALWLFHLHNPQFLFNVHGIFGKVIIFLVLAPPFLTVVSVVHLLLPEVGLPRKMESGLMSSHLQRERTDKRWKIMIMAGMASAVNLLSMILLSSPK